MQDAFCITVRLLVGGRVRGSRRIEDHQVGGPARSDQSAVMQAQFFGRQAGHFVDG